MLENRITMLNLAPDLAHGTMGKEPQSLVLRARESNRMYTHNELRLMFCKETRKTHRAILSEPRLVIPGTQPQPAPPPLIQEASTGSAGTPTPGTKRAFDDIGDVPSETLSKTEPRSSKKRKNKQR